MHYSNKTLHFTYLPDLQKDGVLTTEMVSSRISQLGRFGTGLQHSFYNLSLHMPYLVMLDASHNEISSFFEFQPPKSLKEVNFSHNRMTKMKDLSDCVLLTKLDLDYNSFCEISGLEQCCRLTHLSLAHNKISRISGLGSLPLTHLCLRGNQLERIEGLEHLKSLQVLDLSQNRITSLSGLQNLHLLGSINLEKNLVLIWESFQKEMCDVHISASVLYASGLLLIHELHTQKQINFYLKFQVSSVNKYDPPMDVVAARDHMTHLVYQLMQPQILYESTLPSADSPYPMLVMTGPQGCGKRELAHRLCQEFNKYFAYGICHTTRGPYFGEENGLDYHFVSQEVFQNMIHMGKFIQTIQYGGHSYGLTRDAIEDVAREGLACCVHMELEGVFSLKKSYFEPRYILLIPTQVEKYIGHLKSRGLYTPAQIDIAVSRIQLYANTSSQRPGFFDNVIPCGIERKCSLECFFFFFFFMASWSFNIIQCLIRCVIIISSDQLAAAVSPSSDRRPGSNVKPILPPIPTGRRTPAAPSLSPSPSPNPAVEEGRDANMEG
uniref:Leucine rich repeats and guanylate kinase domain containing n=1 Tax=Amphilophus citrinellus TaxID=61819 RepID=A0A3Q0T092_AMPCI